MSGPRAEAGGGLRGRVVASWRRTLAWVAAVTPGTAVLVLAIVAVAPALAVRGLVATRAAGDSPFLLVRVHEYAAALGAGQFPVRWMPDAAYGLGLPFWVFYAPLAYAVAAVMVLAGASVVGAIKVTTLGAFVVAALGAYRLGVRHWGAPSAGVLAAAAYTFAPYHMVNLYVRGDALAETVAYAILPWVLVTMDRARDRRSPGAVAALAAAVAALLVSHNVSALLAAP
ncbi:MAG: 6-pyruvoyl-tetrahydropterin synthase-related protein, partial [Anaerolineae bacterium]